MVQSRLGVERRVGLGEGRIFKPRPIFFYHGYDIISCYIIIDNKNQQFSFKKFLAPSPKQTTISLSREVKLKEQPFHDSQKRILSNETAEAIIHYTLPAGWSADEVEPVFLPLLMTKSLNISPPNLVILENMFK